MSNIPPSTNHTPKYVPATPWLAPQNDIDLAPVPHLSLDPSSKPTPTITLSMSSVRPLLLLRLDSSSEMSSGYSSDMLAAPSLISSDSRATSPSGFSERSWCSHIGIYNGILGRPEKRMFISTDLCTLDESLETQPDISDARETAPKEVSRRGRTLHRHTSNTDEEASIFSLKEVERKRLKESGKSVLWGLRRWLRNLFSGMGGVQKRKRAPRQDREMIKISPRQPGLE